MLNGEHLFDTSSWFKLYKTHKQKISKFMAVSFYNK